MSYTVVTLNDLASSSAVPELLIVNVRRQLVGARRDTFVEVPGRAGSWAFREEPGDRTITIVCDLEGSSFANRRAALEALADWADTPVGPVAMQIDDTPDRHYLVMLATAPDVDEWLTCATLELEYRATPYALADDISVQTFATVHTADTDEWATPDSVIAYPEITVKANGGTLLTLELTLAGASTSDTISWAGTVAAAGLLVISSVSSTVVKGASIDADLTGRYTPANLDMGSVDGSFPIVVPGDNGYALTYTGTATSVDLTIKWRRLYR